MTLFLTYITNYGIILLVICLGRRTLNGFEKRTEI